jgi:SAM-dependent methyltransferase
VHQEPTILRFFRDWWRRERSAFGFYPALRGVAHVVRDFLRESLPEHRRRRYGDMDYDWNYRVDTTSATVGWRTRLLGLLHTSYQPIEPEFFREVIGKLAIDFAQFTFIDIGSGKGRALLLAAEYPFARIVGIELLPELNRVAQENICKFTLPPPFENHEGWGSRIEAFCEDASDYTFPSEPLVIFLFNPLPEWALRKLGTNLDRSIREHARRVYVVYVNPVFVRIFESSPHLAKVCSTAQCAIFESLA